MIRSGLSFLIGICGWVTIKSRLLTYSHLASGYGSCEIGTGEEAQEGNGYKP